MEILQIITSSAAGIAAAVVVFGLCIFFHEAGHFLAAKAARMRVDAFALGFGPQLLAHKRGETTYSIRVIPLGGYVAIAGMEPGETQVPNGFHSRPRWMGALTIIAGVAMNMVLAVLLYTLVIYSQGLPRADAAGTRIGGIYPGTPAAESELRAGDEIVAIDGNRLGLAVEKVAPGSVADRLGIQAGDRVMQVRDDSVSAPTDLLTRLRGSAQGPQRLVVRSARASATSAFQNLSLPPVPQLAESSSSEPSEAAAWLERELGITFAPLSQTDIVMYTILRPETQLILTVSREGQEVRVPVTTYALQERVLHIDAEGRINTPYATIGRVGLKLQALTEPVSLSRAFVLGAGSSVAAVAAIVESIHAMITRKIAAAPGGPVSIFALSFESARLGWAEVATFAAFLSANLAVLNLLPIPPLDGFVLLVLGYEAVRRRRIDARAEYLVKLTGFLLLMGLVLLLTFNDVKNLILHGSP
ncbi:MAG: hypothetical protein GX100_05545 [candidate division WS1 bacterium]|jgi:regulator of sigma E protease|nr:hypothetical protein [candidate division WS1 bacterium]